MNNKSGPPVFTGQSAHLSFKAIWLDSTLKCCCGGWPHLLRKKYFTFPALQKAATFLKSWVGRNYCSKAPYSEHNILATEVLELATFGLWDECCKGWLQNPIISQPVIPSHSRQLSLFRTLETGRLGFELIPKIAYIHWTTCATGE